MPLRLLLAATWLFSFGLSLQASPPDGQLIHGPNYEGVIFTPEMMKTSHWSAENQIGLWTPTPDLIRKAEAALPTAIAERIKYAKPVRGPWSPTYYTPKSGTDLHITNTPKSPNIPDSEIENNFLYNISDQAYYRRQYIGQTIDGKKVLLLSFFLPLKDPGLKDWRSHWIEVLGGYALFWNVTYDPATNTFSNWES